VSEKPKGITCGLLILASAFAALDLALIPIRFRCSSGTFGKRSQERISCSVRPRYHNILARSLRRRRRISSGIIFHKEPIFLDTSYQRFIVLGSHDSCRRYQDASRLGFVGLHLHPQGVATEAVRSRARLEVRLACPRPCSGTVERHVAPRAGGVD
jgi:hypothetical protein